MKQKDLTPIYLEAARRIAERENVFSCWGIAGAVDGEKSNWRSYQECDFYQSVFYDEEPYSFANAVSHAAFETDISRNHFRVMLLCMMAACWKDFV